MTERQRSVYDAIVGFQRENGYPPTVRDLCKVVGLKSTATMAWHLNRLQDGGYIKWGNSKARSIVIVEPRLEQSA
jgi:repressor LexA